MFNSLTVIFVIQLEINKILSTRQINNNINQCAAAFNFKLFMLVYTLLNV